MSPWLITSFGLAATRHLVLTLLALRHHRSAALVAALALITVTVGYRATLSVRRRSGSRKGSTF